MNNECIIQNKPKSKFGTIFKYVYQMKVIFQFMDTNCCKYSVILPQIKIINTVYHLMYVKYLLISDY